ncbi:ubiquitin carboxyl-terminal hydrolase [Thraustotheca clavata]|uniref:Ubiquitin carboxyl-terminal hydrolase n=1 Tax=Thraustotheca clavata TaxID=74557 RepID=A0A1V9ZQA8_9STRA|nr:ubiquitin carboxyl-terminal hydrolase [Thraustotheca clavata]
MSTEERSKRWFPLESNPNVMNDYIRRMGVPDDCEYEFCDVYSTEDWALDMVLRPVLAVIMLFPIKAHTEEFAKGQQERIVKGGQYVSPNVYFMKQTVGNACGTVGILHALGNVKDAIKFREGSFLDTFFKSTRGKTPEEIAAILEEDDELEENHTSAAQEGQSDQLEHVDDPINTHFVCFTTVDDKLYELDGRKAFPINHGLSSDDLVLENACNIINGYMQRDEGEIRFTIVALAKKQEY